MALYNDLNLPKLELEEIETLRSRVNHLETSLYTSEEERKSLINRNKASEETVIILERNISSLFSTARLEIKRKDEELLRLRALLARERAIAYAKEEMLRNWLIELTQASESVRSSIRSTFMKGDEDKRIEMVEGHLEKWGYFLPI